MKIDTQACELEVLQGAVATLAQTRVLTAELTLRALYSNGDRVSDIYAFLEAAGFHAIAITEAFLGLDSERDVAGRCRCHPVSPGRSSQLATYAGTGRDLATAFASPWFPPGGNCGI